VFRKHRTYSVTISAELHDRILRTCAPIEQNCDEIVSVRSRTRASNMKFGEKSLSDAATCTRMGGSVALHFVC
jgi:hypothetical protein